MCIRDRDADGRRLRRRCLECGDVPVGGDAGAGRCGAARQTGEVDAVSARPSVVVLDYGFGNVRSAVRALERVGAAVELTADATAAAEADGLVVPGVGAFAAVMRGLE